MDDITRGSRYSQAEITLPKGELIVGVIGAGAMGRGIAQVAATGGMKVLLTDSRGGVAQEARQYVEKMLARSVEKKAMTTEDAKAAVDRIQAVGAVSDLASCHVVIEAVIENLDVKQSLFAELENVVTDECILASNTSSLSITTIASHCRHPQRVAGFHFFNPVPLMKLVEVIRALTTSEETNRTLTGFAASLGKEPIAAPDRPGFIVNRLLVPYLLDAIREYERGLGTIEDIDKGMKLGCGHPMGPFTLLDFVGLDTTYYIANIMFEEFREPRFAPPPLLKRMVLSGFHGRKTKRGFYTY